MTDTPEEVRLADSMLECVDDSPWLTCNVAKMDVEAAAAILRRIPDLGADAENYRARLFSALEADPILKAAHEQVDDCRRNPTFMDMSNLLDVASANFTERKRVEAERDQLRAELEKVRMPDVVKVDAGFCWDGEAQHHIPTLLVEFEPVPVNGPCDSKGWRDRDALAAMLTAAPTPPHADQKGQ